MKPIHPNSLANLSRDGRPLSYEEPKKARSVSITATGWDGLRATAKEMGISVSELLERLGRGDFAITPSKPNHHSLDQAAS